MPLDLNTLSTFVGYNAQSERLYTEDRQSGPLELQHPIPKGVKLLITIHENAPNSLVRLRGFTESNSLTYQEFFINDCPSDNSVWFSAETDREIKFVRIQSPNTLVADDYTKDVEIQVLSQQDILKSVSGEPVFRIENRFYLDNGTEYITNYIKNLSKFFIYIYKVRLITPD